MIKSSKRLIAMLICLAMVLSMIPMSVFAAGTTVYLQPNDNWLQSGAWFAVWTWPTGGDAQWITGTGPDADGLYAFELPEGNTNVIFVRMNPASSTADWSNKWNQTGDMVVDASKTICAISGWDSGSWIEKGEEVVVDTNYYLRGTLYNWSDCNDTNRMTNNGDGTWSITMSLAAGTYEYKAAWADWSNGVPSEGNQTIIMTNDADVTFTLDTNAGTLTHDYVATCPHTNVTAVAGKDATCTEAGLTAGSVCADCGTTIVAQTEIPALGHTTTVEGETCERCGLVMEYITVYFENNWMFQDLTAYWWGSSFGTNPEWPGVAPEEFATTDAGLIVYSVEVPSDAAGVLFAGKDNDYGNDRKTPNIAFEAGKVYYMNWTEELGEHVASYDVSVFEPTCEHEYVYACDAHCMHCGELTNEDAAHSIIKVEAVEAVCGSNGNVEYYTCEYCGGCWLDEALTLVTNRFSVITFKDHNIVHVEAVDATCFEQKCCVKGWKNRLVCNRYG